MVVRRIENEDIKEVVGIHESAFKNFFLTILGSKFLTTYYNSVNRAEDGVLIGCFDDDKLVGFISGSLLCCGFNSRLIKNNLFSFCFVGISLFFSMPKALLRLKNNMRKEDANHEHEDNGNYVELSSIGVDPSCQGKGVGALLLMAFEDYCIKNNKKLITLTTDFYNNDNVVNFYKNNGYEVWYDFVSYPNRRMYKMRKDL